jgi:AcrR family transcriptional regulator
MRVRPESWFSDLLRAATTVFTARGYRQTQMSDIAREMGVSQGTLYNYVESKEALFLLVCEQGFSETPIRAPRQPPVPSPSFEAMIQGIRERMRSIAGLNALGAALRTENPADARAELEGVLREFYSVIARNRHGFDLVERSARDVPELAQLLFVEGRRKGVTTLSRYISSRIESGHFKPVPDVPTAARFVVEAVTWFARHRHNTPDSQMISDHDALETTIHFLVSALIPGGRHLAGGTRKRGAPPRKASAEAMLPLPQRQ